MPFTMRIRGPINAGDLDLEFAGYIFDLEKSGDAFYPKGELFVAYGSNDDKCWTLLFDVKAGVVRTVPSTEQGECEFLLRRRIGH